MIALLVIDMQVGLFQGEPPRHDAAGVIWRINAVGRSVRKSGGIVVFIQHEDQGGLEHGSPGWQILPEMERTEADLLVHKQACDSFYESDLAEQLERHGVHELIITGCATDFCVDTTVRAAASRDYAVTVVSDGHTTKDRPHLDAVSIITHHNYMWANLILPHGEVKVMPAIEVIHGLQPKIP